MEISLVNKIQEIRIKAVEMDDPDAALHEINNLEKLGEGVVRGIAELWVGLSEDWDKFSRSGTEAFGKYVVSSGKNPALVQTYIEVYRQSPKLPESLQNKPIRELGPIAKAMTQGYDLEEYYDELENCSSDFDVRDVLRKAKGQEPRKSALLGELKEDGTLMVYKGGQIDSAGFLDIYSDNPIVQQFIDRLCIKMGVKRNDIS